MSEADDEWPLMFVKLNTFEFMPDRNSRYVTQPSSARSSWLRKIRLYCGDRTGRGTATAGAATESIRRALAFDRRHLAGPSASPRDRVRSGNRTEFAG